MCPFVALGYIEAAVIPAGARRIRVVEDKPAHSFLGKRKKKENFASKLNFCLYYAGSSHCDGEEQDPCFQESAVVFLLAVFHHFFGSV